MGHRDIHTECHMEMKTEIGVMLLQASGQQSLPGNHQKLGKSCGVAFPRKHPAHVLISDLQPPQLGDLNILVIKSLSWEYFIQKT